MGLRVGSVNISKIYLGNTEIKKAYLGSLEVFGGLKYIVEVFKQRVLADGGVVEAIDCVNEASWNTDDKNWAYLVRVTNDNGVVEAFDCINIT
jgi:hypothetical protein